MSTSLAPMRRGVQLLALQAQYPGKLARAVLTQQLSAFIEDPKDLDRDCAYLSDKGYATWAVEHFEGGASVLMGRITAAGIDLIDGVSTDPGVHIQRGGR